MTQACRSDVGKDDSNGENQQEEEKRREDITHTLLFAVGVSRKSLKLDKRQKLCFSVG